MAEKQSITNYDKYLKRIKGYIFAITFVLEIIVICSGIALILLAVFDKKEATNNQVDVLLLLIGVGILIFGSFLVFISYFAGMAVVGSALDVKYIRNKMYEIDNRNLFATFNKNDGLGNVKTGTCDICKKKNTEVVYCEVTNEDGKFYKYVCTDCLKKNQDSSEKE